ncbi:hypothetical protein [Nocardioides sp.]|uniref:hypothetical protein n=1 Tax=Nocardioides sp. TaxID=35761 RepID=UPI002CB6058C|nr:hypothetical protein [Nocardioides sp.]HSX68114.1 hypothetical protein [Nocardioides sp.]
MTGPQPGVAASVRDCPTCQRVRNVRWTHARDCRCLECSHAREHRRDPNLLATLLAERFGTPSRLS